MLKRALIDRAFDARQSGDLKTAETLYRELVASIEYSLGPHHFDLAVALHNLVQVLESQGKTEESAKLRDRATRILLREHKNRRDGDGRDGDGNGNGDGAAHHGNDGKDYNVLARDAMNARNDGNG